MHSSCVPILVRRVGNSRLLGIEYFQGYYSQAGGSTPSHLCIQGSGEHGIVSCADGSCELWLPINYCTK